MSSESLNVAHNQFSLTRAALSTGGRAKTKFLSVVLLGVVGITTLATNASAQPYSHTQPAAPVTTNSATLNGMAVPNGLATVAWFEWGANGTFTSSTTPVNVGNSSNVVRVSAPIAGLESGKSYSCRLVVSNSAGLRVGREQRFITGGKVIAWGITDGRIAVPSYLRDAVAVASFARHSLALRADGTVAAWADSPLTQPIVPAGLSNIVAVAAGTSHCLALRNDGTVVSWGNRTIVPGDLTNVIAIAAGGSSVALKADGTVVTWAASGALVTNTLTSLSNMVAISASGNGILALKANGTLTASGPPPVSAFDTNITGNTSGRSHHLMLLSERTVYASGTFDNIGSISIPVGLSNVIAIAGGASHDLVLKTDGTLVTWGKYLTPSLSQVTTYIPAAIGSNVSVIACGSDHSLAIRPLSPEDFKPYAHTQLAAPVTTNSATLNGMVVPNGVPTMAWFEWGTTTNYENITTATNVGSGTSVVRVSEPLTGLSPNTDYYFRLVGSNTSGVAFGRAERLTTGSKVATWGALSSSLAGPLQRPFGLGAVVKIAAGHGHCLALKPDGRVVVWGGYTSAVTNIPPSLTNAVEIAGGYAHSLAIQSDGTVVAWGSYLGGGSINPPSGLSNVIAVAGGDSHSMALKNDGTVTAWGTNNFGQSQVPAGLDNVVAIAAGATFSVALRADGSVVVWGRTLFSDLSVLPPTGLSNVVAISSSVYITLALKSDGKVVAWGDTSFGPEATFVPLGMSNVVAVAVGQRHGMALKNDGSVTLWGANTYGQRDIPVGLSNVMAVAAGDYHSLALASNMPPQGKTVVAATTPNTDLIIPLSATDPNGDLVSLRIATLPTAGILYQYVGGGRGSQFTATDIPVSDSSGRVIFAPASNTLGAPYASFSFLANDGELDSSPATVTINVITPPLISLDGLGSGVATNGPFALTFTGFSNATYRVWASTNLVNWTVLGAASQPTPGVFTFSDLTRTNLPRRFYRISSP